MDILLVGTVELLRTFLDSVKACPNDPPSFYIDLEGDDLCRHGTVSLITILVVPHHKVYLIDVATLGRSAFDTSTADGNTLRQLLESDRIAKVFFDIRNDSDALYSLYGVNVAGIEDIQLMELASRNFSKRCVHGLAKCIENDAKVDYETRRNWRNVKDNGRRLFDPARGGSYAVFAERPMSTEVRDYCVQDVALMPNLRDVYRAKLCDAWWRKIEDETRARIRLSQSVGYNGKGRHMALGPSHWIGWSPSISQRSERTLLERPVPASDHKEDPTPKASEQQATDTSPTLNSGQANPETEDASLGPDGRALQQLSLLRSHDVDDDSENGSNGDRYGTSYHGGGLHYHNSNEDDDQYKDLTACDSECGYCGQSMRADSTRFGELVCMVV
ncbi:hypothetical protein LTS14_005481 [Recurvomyces mirabilis]|uniref:uncharacterized protein n=1 Tax=Recurvomyces mirabilis TaxID=574656 RepID=UPI002DDFA58F|nr:hypothetical protein LTS14_005481 [Recurvomyces mirabilis]